MRVAGRGYRDGVRNLEVMVESLSGGSKPERQEEVRVMLAKNFLFSVLGGREERRTTLNLRNNSNTEHTDFVVQGL